MSWIKIDTSLATKPEVFQIARDCKTPRPTVVGHLLMFWGWLDCNSRDGQHLPLSTADIDEIAGLPGFTKAMVTAQWLVGEDGDYSIPRYDRHNGNSAKARALEAEAKRLRRMSDEEPADVSDSCPTNPPANVGPEKRREEKNTHTPRARVREEPPKAEAPKPNYIEQPPPIPISPTAFSDRAGQTGRSLPEVLDTPAFRAAWDRWCDYLAERNGGRASPIMTLEAHLQELAKMGAVMAVQAIENAIAAGLRKPCLPPGQTPGSGGPQKPPPTPKKTIN